MNSENLKIGKYIMQPQGFRAFVPNPFPPAQDITLEPKLNKKHAQAMLLLGKLNGISRLLPDHDYFLEMFVRKDASESSQIEGTQASMIDAIAAANIDRSSNLPVDVDDILHYIDALNYGLARSKNFPFTLRFICELHNKLMTDVRSTHLAYPGEFRRTQNWIGGTRPDNARFVPPPIEEMNRALGDFEKFIHADDNYLPLIKAALLHAQFETIHPFIDGNGRTGRMIITMYLCNSGILEFPALYLSSYFKKYRDVYYERLQSYQSENSDVCSWLDFFLDGVIEISKSSINICEKIVELRERDLSKVEKLGKKTAAAAVNVLKNLYRVPAIGIAEVISWSGYASKQSAYSLVKTLTDERILYQLNENENYGKKYIYKDYVALFNGDSSL
ncbi:MAG: Fic family protein [Endomicrobium sp.]|jgi:Fic family protein|nr:Fic family protein [Endomicrobium sp.]